MPKSKVRKINYGEALAEGLVQSMDKDKSVIVMGQSAEEVKGGMFGTLKPALDKYGDSRMFEMPLSEGGITGWGTGAALMGLKPVMTHHRNDFLLLALDQIANHAAKWMYMHRRPVPWTIRTIIGRGWGQGPQHAQSLQAIFAYFPGLKVVMPSTAYDAKGLLISAIEDPNPVIFIEHRRLFGQVGNVPKNYYKVPIGKANMVRKGKDATVAVISQMRLEAELAAEALEKIGISLEIVDLRTIRPLDKKTILKSVEKTGRLIVCDTGWVQFGVSAEIAAVVSDEAYESLKAPIKRIGMPACPTPASYALENVFYPGVKDVIKAVTDILPKEKVSQIKKYATTHKEMTEFIGIF